jgi:phosphoenolpyruvate carboxylase
MPSNFLHPSWSSSLLLTRTFSTYSSFAEPDPTLFGQFLPTTASSSTISSSSSSSSSTATTTHQDAPLRADIRVMGSVLGQVICEHEGQDIFDKVEHMRSLAKAWRNHAAPAAAASASAAAAAAAASDSSRATTASDRDEAAFEALTQLASNLNTAELYKVARAFTHFLSIANAAERHHRSRRLKQAVVLTNNDQNDLEPPPAMSSGGGGGGGALWPKKDSCGGVIPDLLRQGHDAETIWHVLSTQCTELVLTAHPTEVNRRTLLEKNQRIQQILTIADQYRSSNNVSSYELQQLDNAMYREIGSIWQSDEVSRTKPTPVQEAEKGTLVLETVLWDAVPQFVRKLDATARQFLGERRGLPLETAAPVRLASWMGGDRDGNPNVTPNTTRQVCLHNRRKAAELFAAKLQQLQSELSITSCSLELRASALMGQPPPTTSTNDSSALREPYRAYLRPMIQKLHRTRAWANQELDQLLDENQQRYQSDATTPRLTTQDIYLSKDDFMKELMVIHRSLCSTGNEMTADGTLTDIIRNVAAFGLTLIPLDVRQESDRHEEALDAITRFLGLGSYAQWDEESKISWLTSQISSRRPLIRSGVWRDHPDIFSPTAVDTLETFRMIADQHEGSLGAYVISQATNASDVLAVLLLQLDAGVKKTLRVAPLFETLDDLNGAAATMKKLFSLPVYMGHINGQQEVMIGYSDSAKDAGRYVVWHMQLLKMFYKLTVNCHVGVLCRR